MPCFYSYISYNRNMKTIKEIFKTKDLNKEIEIQGWARNVRASKEVVFLAINDGSCFSNIQVVASKELSNFSDIEKLNIISSLKIKGVLVESQGKGQNIEIQAKEIEIIGTSDSDYPLQKKRHTFEYLREISHLRPRSNTFSAVFRVRSLLSYAIHKFFQERDFIYVQTPIITASDCEGAGELFKLEDKEFFGKEVGLTVSGQLQAETFAMAFSKVYTFGPTFRAENSNTKRHAAEFQMIEPEIAFADLKDNMDLAENMIKYLIKYILDNAKEEMEFFNTYIDKELKERLEGVISSEFKRITYTESIEILNNSKQKFEYKVEWGKELQTEHERYLAEVHFKCPVFVYDYPKDTKAFYMKQNDDKKTVAALDLLVPKIGEIIGGSQREDDYDKLLKRMKEMNVDEKELQWYLDLRKYGGTPHAGFGLGFERLLMYITGMENVRDVIPFPRTPGNIMI